jgi:hypothetical protein
MNKVPLILVPSKVNLKKGTQGSGHLPSTITASPAIYTCGQNNNFVCKGSKQAFPVLACSRETLDSLDRPEPPLTLESIFVALKIKR